MNTKTLLLIGAGALLTGGSGWAQPTIASELERGVELLESGTNLEKAKEHLEMVIHRKRESDKLAAEAYYHLAKCELALGERERAQKLVDLLRKDWPADNAWVIRAGELPLRQGIFRAAPWASGERLTYEMKFQHDGQEVGSAMLSTLIVASGDDGEDQWTRWDMGDTEISSYTFGGDDYRLTKGHLMLAPGPIEIFETDEEGNLILRDPDIDKPLATFATGNGEDPIYQQLQAMDLVRVLPAKLDGRAELPFIYPGEPWNKTTYSFRSAGEETVEVPAGKFDCVVYTMDSEHGQAPDTYWVEKDGARRVIRMNLHQGTAIISLVSSEVERSLEEPQRFKVGNKPGGLQLTVPAGLVAMRNPGSAPALGRRGAEHVGIYDTKLRVWGGLVMRVPLPEEDRENVEAEGLSEEAVTTLMQVMEQESVMKGGPEPVKVEEIREARKLVEDNGETNAISRLKVNNGSMKHERTVLISLEDGSVILSYFDHEIGKGDAAASLLTEIRRSL